MGKVWLYDRYYRNAHTGKITGLGMYGNCESASMTTAGRSKRAALKPSPGVLEGCFTRQQGEKRAKGGMWHAGIWLSSGGSKSARCSALVWRTSSAAVLCRLIIGTEYSCNGTVQYDTVCMYVARIPHDLPLPLADHSIAVTVNLAAKKG